MNKERRRLCWEIWITAALVSSDLFRRLGGRHAQARFTVDNKFRRVVAPVLLAIMLSFTCSLRVSGHGRFGPLAHEWRPRGHLRRLAQVLVRGCQDVWLIASDLSDDARIRIALVR